MKLKHWVRFLLTRDTTWHGQFRALRPLLPSKEGLVVDVGANDGFYSSNSYPFIWRGWRAILIEPHPDAFAKVTKLHAHNPRVVTLNLACGEVPGEGELNLITGNADGGHSFLTSEAPQPHKGSTIARTLKVQVLALETILNQQKVPSDFSLLSIDTEGHDLQVLKGVNLHRFRPRVIITEKGLEEEVKSQYLGDHGYHLRHEVDYDTIWTAVDSN